MNKHLEDTPTDEEIIEAEKIKENDKQEEMKVFCRDKKEIAKADKRIAGTDYPVKGAGIKKNYALVNDKQEEWDWRDFDGALMDFQIYVREATGGNDYNAVDVTKFKKQVAKWVSSLRSKDRDTLIEKISKARKTEIKWAGTTDEEKNVLLANFDGWNSAFDSVKQIILKTLK